MIRRLIPAGLFAALFLFALGPLLTLSRGFTLGDYELQVYPWMKYYAESLGQGRIPLWTSLVQCGFPIFAEGQTAPLYALTLVCFKFLPFRTAYNAFFLLHFLLAGGFMYGFARKRGLSSEAAALAVMAFVFGSAFGGFFYGIFSMRALVWFPLALWCVEEVLDGRKVWAWPVLALALGQSCLSGYPQMTVYAFGFTLFYAVLRCREKALGGQRCRRVLLSVAGACCAALLVGAPQLWATWLAGQASSRPFQDPGFALWGSVAPWSLATVFFYSWAPVLKSLIYVGTVPVFLILAVPRPRGSGVLWILFLIALVMSLGRFNPLYWIMIKFPFIAFFRNPSKFLYFAAFFLSLIAAGSLDRWSGCRDALSGEAQRAAWRRIAGVLAAAGCALLLALAVVHLMAEPVRNFGHWYVDTFVSGRSYHRHPPEYYREAVEAILRRAERRIHPGDVWIWMPFAFGAAFMLPLFMRRFFGAGGRRLRVFVLALLTLELGLFIRSGNDIGFTGNIGPFPGVSAQSVLPKDARWLEASGSGALLAANKNMLTGHACVNVYSPLANHRYAELLEGWGAVDDGFGRSGFDPVALEEGRPLLDFLGVKYLHLPAGSCPEGMLRSGGAKGGYCRNLETPKVPVKAFFLHGPEGILEGPGVFGACLAGSAYAQIDTEGGEESLRVSVNAPSAGFLVRPDIYDEGWQVRVNGKSAGLRRAGGAFQAVEVPAGISEVEFDFRPDYFTYGVLIQGLGYLILLAGFFRGRRPKTGASEIP